MSTYIREQNTVYLDYNATTPLVPEVKKAIVEGLEFWANPSSDHELSKESVKRIEVARESIGKLLHVSGKEVVFTSGGTEANNWLIVSAIRGFSLNHEDKPHVVASCIEHPSILEPLKFLESSGQIELSLIEIDPSSGQIDLKSLESCIRENTSLVTVMLANNETGVVQPMDKISLIVRGVAKKQNREIILHSDAAQAIGKMDVSLSCVDAVTVVGHKFYGPRIGALVLSQQTTLNLLPWLLGGGQEKGLRSGTENTPMIMGLGAAAQVAHDNLTSINRHLTYVRDYFESQLQDKLGDAHIVHFKSLERLPNTSSVAFPTFQGNSCDLLEKCSTFEASTGAACHTGEVSKILVASGISRELASKTVRFSFGRETTKAEIDRVITELKAMLYLSTYGSSLVKCLGIGSGSQF